MKCEWCEEEEHNHGQMTGEEIAAKMRARVTADVEKHGWSMIGVFPGEPTDPVPTYFAYTVGFWERFRHPEIAVFGINPQTALRILWCAHDEYLKRGEVFSDGQVVTERLIGGNLPVMFRSMPNNLDPCPLNAARAYYQTWDFPVLQMVLPDPRGLFPWDKGCAMNMRITQQIPIRLQSAEA